MVQDLLYVSKWWACIFLIGTIFLPDICMAFENFFDNGYLFSKTIGIALTSYAVWLVSSLRIAPFERTTIVMLLLLAAIVEYGFLKGYRKFAPVMRKNWLVFLGEELLFLAGLIFWSYVRGMQPDIYGLEKYMDFGFVNSILRTRYMPPVDIWFSGKSINYYYYGHYIAAFLTKLCGIDSAISYNIMIATIFSFTLSLSFSAGANLFYLIKKGKLKNAIIAGIISAMLSALGGNLHTVIYGLMLPAAKRVGLYSGKISSYWYADATRYIGYNPPTNDKTISEFPIYSFVVSDLHGHVSDIPFVLTLLGVLLSYIIKKDGDKNHFFILSLLLAVFYMTNTWDYAIYMTVLLFAFLSKDCIIYKDRMHHGGIKKIFKPLLNVVKVFLLSQALCLPFTFYFKNMTGGVGLVSHRSPLYQLLVLWGYQLLLSLCFLLFIIFKGKDKAINGETGETLKSGVSGIFASDIYVILLIISAAGLVMVPEILYVKDIYGAVYQRANTMFKFTYQSFIIFGICSGYIIVRIVSGITHRNWRRIVSICFCIIVALPMIYPYYAIKGYYGSLKPSGYKGLYGLNFLNTIDHDDYEAIMWLRRNVSGQPVVLEASGDSYSDYERISMATGFPTVAGWFAHEWLWRGGPDAPSERAGDVKEIYESKDIDITKLLLKKYKVSYVVIGTLEEQKYPDLERGKFLKLGTVVFQSNQTMIIKISKF